MKLASEKRGRSLRSKRAASNSPGNSAKKPLPERITRHVAIIMDGDSRWAGQGREALDKNGLHRRLVGRLERRKPALRRKVRHSVDLTRDTRRLVLNIAWNYG